MQNKNLKDLLPKDGIEAVLTALDGDLDGQSDRLMKALEPYADHLLAQEVDYKYLAYAIQANLGAAAAKAAATKRKPPYRVRVHDGSGQKLLGEGTYVGDVAVYFMAMPDGSLRSLSNAEEEPSPELIPEGAELIKTADNPKIVLDDGRTVYGCQVWWEPV